MKYARQIWAGFYILISVLSFCSLGGCLPLPWRDRDHHRGHDARVEIEVDTHHDRDRGDRHEGDWRDHHDEGRGDRH